MLEDLIHQILTNITELTSSLAIYNQQPAIFYQQSKVIDDPLWQGNHYPHIVYSINRKYNKEYNLNASLSINIICENNSISPIEIESIIRANFSELFILENNITYAITVDESKSYNFDPYSHLDIVGINVQFNICSIISKFTANPDPIKSTSIWLKEFMPNALIIGIDEMPSRSIASFDTPIIFCSFKSFEYVGRNTNATAYLTANLSLNVFAQGLNNSLTICRTIANGLALAGEIAVYDTSPLLLKKVSINSLSDFFSTGQISIFGEYGVDKSTAPYLYMNHINLN